MKKVLFLIFASLLVLGACGNNDNEKKEDNKSAEHKKSNESKKDIKTEDKKNKSNSNDTANTENKNTSKNDNGKSQNDNGNYESIQKTQNTQKQNSGNQKVSQNNNGYMTQAEIDKWNKTKTTTHDESQMGYGRGDYEEARKASAKVWNDPNAHVGGPRWVGKNEGYNSWAKRQEEVINSQTR
ncbi:hypothetical protein [Staphylococcus lugdunensis]|uniref:hypothetical protein n=1 Tax=Staphylococcus lugdunensis TaxID=28035 RepID=UPI001F592257|nr:hypothetical protein [Staphylococcus lugdunensis]MCI2760844.1 hypothetical protein [Staphylococcus lugdunensis]MCI2794906.1 hypothetical protein [Staphylococcus lugdunensis]MCI2797194.1 hypothetical protein [Staphylococcus lugdunensis]